MTTDIAAIREELEDALWRSERPSVRLEAMRRAGTLHQVPELLTLPGVQQDPYWHPEGDVWIHTCMVVDEAARDDSRPADPHHDRLLRWAALCHDLGKPRCTIFEGGRWRSPGHDEAGVGPTTALLTRLDLPPTFIQEVCSLVRDHLAPHFFAEDRVSAGAVRRLARRLGSVPVELLVRLGRADAFGRTSERARSRAYPSGDWLLERAARLGPEPEPGPPPLVLGRHLIPLGYKPGPVLGQALDRLYEAQLDGAFVDVAGGLAWLASRPAS